MIGKITDVKILKQGRGGLNGLVIDFITDVKINNNTVVQITYNDKLKPFYVKEVEIEDGKFIGRAEEAGYFARKLGNDINLDIRELIGFDVELVTDEERLKRINDESCWC